LERRQALRTFESRLGLVTDSLRARLIWPGGVYARIFRDLRPELPDGAWLSLGPAETAYVAALALAPLTIAP